MQKRLEARKQNLKAKLAEPQMKIDRRGDDTVDFRLMGVDHIFVNEHHCYKNLMFQTHYTGVAGIGNAQGSRRAMNLLSAIRDIQRHTGRDLGVAFLSGTVVIDALAELYAMFKYLRPREFKRQQVSCLGAQAAVFTEKTTDYELNVTDTVEYRERSRIYIKVPELTMLLREITDYCIADMIDLDAPDKNMRFLSSASTIQQEEMTERLVTFAHNEQWKDLGLDIPQPDNLDKTRMLVTTNVARKMSLDMCLLDDKFGDDGSNKAPICTRIIYDYYVRSTANRGTQFVLSDLPAYKPDKWNIYSGIKDKLVAMGILADEIQFIQYAKTERARKKLFADMNNGRVRVLFGSTSMPGTGVNAQGRAVAVHHLETPWHPVDMEQRNGRAARKGSTVKLWGNNTVDVVICGTEETLDAHKFNLLKNKQILINQTNNGTIAVCRIDGDAVDEDNDMNFIKFAVLSSGNTDLLEKARLDNGTIQFEKERAVFKKDHVRAERKITANQEDMIEAESAVERMIQDWEYVTSYTESRTTRLLNLAQATAEEIRRELHRISKTHRNGAISTISTYTGLNLSVYSEYDMSSTLYCNTLLVEGVNGLKYRCGMLGALPPGLVESSRYPQAILEKLPGMIEGQRQKVAKLEDEMPTLKTIIARKWSRADELMGLKQEYNVLQHRIDENIKEAERTQPVPSGHEADDRAA